MLTVCCFFLFFYLVFWLFFFCILIFLFFFFFFFQAEDGIRDLYVTGVQTCALPISSMCSFKRSIKFCMLSLRGLMPHNISSIARAMFWLFAFISSMNSFDFRSEERRVGKECRSRCSRYH